MSFLCMKISEASGLTNAWHGNKAGSAAALSLGLDTFLWFKTILPVRLSYFCIKRYVCNDLEVCIYEVMRLLQVSFLLILQVYTRTLFKRVSLQSHTRFLRQWSSRKWVVYNIFPAIYKFNCGRISSSAFFKYYSILPLIRHIWNFGDAELPEILDYRVII